MPFYKILALFLNRFSCSETVHIDIKNSLWSGFVLRSFADFVNFATLFFML